MELHNLIKEEYKNILRENFEYVNIDFDNADSMESLIELIKENILKSLYSISKVILNLPKERRYDLTSVKNILEFIEKIEEDINIAKDLSEQYEEDEMFDDLDNLLIKVSNIHDSVYRLFDDLDYILININDKFDEFEWDVRKYINKMNIIKEELEDIECNKQFDLDSIYKEYVEFYMPLYSIINKHKTAKLKYMTPKQYIYNVARGFGGLSYEETISPTNNEFIRKYAEDMNRGDKFPVIYYTKNKSGQEGRHRALAAEKIGCKYIPVIEFIDLTPSEVKIIAMQFSGDSFEEVNDYFIEDGFEKGITQKCYYDLQMYLERNNI
jgi:hypothetical protein